MLVLGIDTSCDDTSCGIVGDGNSVLANVVSTQLVHSEYGGVVPELASRDHIKNIIPVVKDTLNQAKIKLTEIDGIGITYGPGLPGSLFVGLSFAKALAVALEIPFVGVNHIEGHIFSLFIDGDIQTPFIGLVVSGGHTEVILVKEKGHYQNLGTTLDDAAGEAFDKVARLLGLKYPGGPEIERVSNDGDPEAVNFPRADVSGYDFSFSGLKTAVLYYLKDKAKPKAKSSGVAASFQEAVVDSLISKIIIAVENTGIRKVGIAGGVARNSRLRAKMHELGKKEKIEVHFPSKEFCTDNGAMIACCAHYHLSKGEKSPLTLRAESRALL
jgi:N6-L-threonylcarbamoyladenine synthase